MADWQSKIDVSDVWQQAKREELAAPELGQAVAARIKSSNAWRRFHEDDGRELEDIADEFEGCDDMDAIDEAMHRLYDWGDAALDDHWAGKKRCWIETHGRQPA